MYDCVGVSQSSHSVIPSQWNCPLIVELRACMTRLFVCMHSWVTVRVGQRQARDMQSAVAPYMY